MSSTKRNKERNDTATQDFYETPLWVSRSLYRLGIEDLPVPTLDAGAGTGNLSLGIRAVYPESRILGIELDSTLASVATARGLHCIVGDCLAQSWRGEHVISNPPFANLLAFLTKGIDEAETLILLARQAVLAGRARKAIFDIYPPCMIVTLSERARFTTGSGDSCDYNWLVWKRNQDRDKTRLYWIDSQT